MQGNIAIFLDFRMKFRFIFWFFVSHSYTELKKEQNEIKMGIPIAACFNRFSAIEKVELECDKCKKKQSQST